MNLIPIADITSICFLSENIPPAKYQALLDMAQEDLRSVLHPALYTELSNQYATTPTTLTAANTLLYDKIKKFLAWQTNFYFQKFSNSSSTPTGIREFKDENSDLLSDVKMFSYEKNIRERAVFYKDEIINFLREARINDANAYPLWKDICQDNFSFAITSVTGAQETRTEIFKSTRYNE